MPRVASWLLTCSVVLTACANGASTTEADRATCDRAAKVSSIGAGDSAARRPATSVLGELSGLTPDNERLVRAVGQARDDAQAVVDGFSPLSYPKIEAGVAALNGSLSGISDVCGDLGL
jgi:hypothetical protein